MTTHAEITIPVYNEEKDLPKCIGCLTKFLAEQKSFESSIVIADNASTDRTWELAQDLANTYPNVKAIHIPRKGRGFAVRTVWMQSQANIVAYMDVDLSVPPRFFPLLIQAIGMGYDVAIGSRLLPSSRTHRCFKRELSSRVYNALVKVMFRPHFADAQCGFKAVRAEVAKALLPRIENQNWFFDTELLLLAERTGYRVYEIPVEWNEDEGTTVNILRTAIEDIRGLTRVYFK